MRKRSVSLCSPNERYPMIDLSELVWEIELEAAINAAWPNIVDEEYFFETVGLVENLRSPSGSNEPLTHTELNAWIARVTGQSLVNQEEDPPHNDRTTHPTRTLSPKVPLL